VLFNAGFEYITYDPARINIDQRQKVCVLFLAFDINVFDVHAQVLQRVLSTYFTEPYKLPLAWLLITFPHKSLFSRMIRFFCG